ncbi:MAG: cyclophilin family peptidyl-prolyl cis-trans isomerase [Verrucomicrobiales bacterium]|jgi:cyclophilin family peptidyl-prolyl cis-trans isomerase
MKPVPVAQIISGALILTFGLTACTVMHKVENMIPEVPEILLIGDKKAPASPTDPANLTPDLKNDVAVFKFDVQGQTRSVVIQLYANEAPITVANFQQQVRSKHYKGMAIHRAIPNYLIQMGDPQSKDHESRAAWGTGGLETSLPAEIKLRHRLGAVGMARLNDTANPGRQSSGSQFYITTGDLQKLDGSYTIFGQVIQGYATLQTISQFPADENDNPYQRIEIQSAQLDQSSRYTPEDIRSIHRKARRRTIEEMPVRQEGRLKRTWRQLW